MINTIRQGYNASVNLSTNNSSKEIKNEQTQKSEDRLSKIAEQIKNGSYKLDMRATASAVVDSLI